MDKSALRSFITHRRLDSILEEYPYAENFFASMRIDIPDLNMTIGQVVDGIPGDYFLDYGASRAQFVEEIIMFIDELNAKTDEPVTEINSLTVLPGRDKNGKTETHTLEIKQGETVCIVGPTGSGKSRLLEDIESLAQNDTPTGRTILINGQLPGDDIRFNLENRLIAQLSQNMNFVMDLSVKEFLKLHAESRGISCTDGITDEIICCANSLAGEKFNGETQITQLSGGQSRSLMIADTALLSESPLVLIDEIENAGIDKKKALDIFLSQNKIVLMATHDPVLALLGTKRAVIKNGGISDIIETTPEEKLLLPALEQADSRMTRLKNIIRSGGALSEEALGL